MTTFTLVHVVLSLVGIGTGFVVVFGLIAAKQLKGWTALFLATTVATSLTGFLFPFHKLLPSHVVGIVSLVVLTVAIRPSSLRRLALDLRGKRRCWPVSEFLRLCSTGLSEGASPEGNGPHTV